MREIRFLCLAVSRRPGGRCIAGIDLDTGNWIRPVDCTTHGAVDGHQISIYDSVAPANPVYASIRKLSGRQDTAAKNEREYREERSRIMRKLDIVRLRIGNAVGTQVQPENWELLAPDESRGNHDLVRSFNNQVDRSLLLARLKQDCTGPLLHSYGETMEALLPRHSQLSHSLTLIRPNDLHWKVEPHPRWSNKTRVRADFKFDFSAYSLVVTDPEWEDRCSRIGPGRHPHMDIEGGSNNEMLLAISLTEKEKDIGSRHYKLVAGVVEIPKTN